MLLANHFFLSAQFHFLHSSVERNKTYCQASLEEIRENRFSKRNLYQKITDMYATTIDYNSDAPTTGIFFKKDQN